MTLGNLITQACASELAAAVDTILQSYVKLHCSYILTLGVALNLSCPTAHCLHTNLQQRETSHLSLLCFVSEQSF